MTWARLRLAIANHFPVLGPLRRRLVATIDQWLPVRESYSQHAEDRWLAEELKKWNLDGGCYVDVGSNHPTRISNTYLLYRRGYKGVVVEPNAELLRLHSRVRPRDICVNVGCAAEASLGTFRISSTPVLSSFVEEGENGLEPAPRILRTERVALLPLDLIMSALGDPWVFLLSVDTEGFDEQVLAGAPKTLQRTLLVCVEANSGSAIAGVDRQLNRSHDRITQFGCNLIYRSKCPPTAELVSLSRSTSAASGTTGSARVVSCAGPR